jgi:hypothetical protein
VDEETLKQKLKERNEVLKELVQWWSLQHHELAGNNNHTDHPDTLEYLLDAHRLTLAAALELAEKQADRIALHQKNVETLKDEEKRTDALVKAGKFSSVKLNTVASDRLQAEIDLAVAKSQGKPDKEEAIRIHDLKKKKLKTIEGNIEVRKKNFDAGTGSGLIPIEVSHSLLCTQLDLTEKPTDRIAIYEAFLKEVKAAEDLLVKVGQFSFYEYQLGRAEYLQGQIGLLREKAKNLRDGNDAITIKKLLEDRRDDLRVLTKAIIGSVEFGTFALTGLPRQFQVLHRPFQFLMEIELEMTSKKADRLVYTRKMSNA